MSRMKISFDGHLVSSVGLCRCGVYTFTFETSRDSSKRYSDEYHITEKALYGEPNDNSEEPIVNLDANWVHCNSCVNMAETEGMEHEDEM